MEGLARADGESVCGGSAEPESVVTAGTCPPATPHDSSESLNPEQAELGAPTIELTASATCESLITPPVSNSEDPENHTSPLIISNTDIPMLGSSPSQTPPTTFPSTVIATVNTPQAISPILLASLPADPTTPATSNTSIDSTRMLLEDDHSNNEPGDDATNNDQPLAHHGATSGAILSANDSHNPGRVDDNVGGAVSCGVATISDDTSTLSGWLKDSVLYFRAILTDKDWQDLISKWVTFELCCRTEGVSISFLFIVPQIENWLL